MSRAVVAVSLGLLPILALRPVGDPSPWLHLKVGQFLLEGKRFSVPDPWAPFATQEYLPTQWLPSVVTAELYAAFGPAAIAWERAAGITALAVALMLWATTLARVWVAAAATTLAIFAAWPALTERPQLAGFVLLVPVLAAWWGTAEDRRPRWWVVPLTWVAAATHGVWAIGAGVGALVTVSLLLSRRLTRRQSGLLIGLLAACAAAAACTPLGPRLLLTPFTVGSQGRQFVQEWMASSVRSPHVMAALMMLFATWLIWVSTQHRPERVHLFLLLVGLVLVLSAQRTVAVGAMIGLPLLCAAAERALQRKRSVTVNSLPVLLVVTAPLCGVVAAMPFASLSGSEPVGVPVKLRPQLERLPSGERVLVEGDMSGWLLFAAPQTRPVFDLRVESYPAKYIKRYIAVMDAEPGWQDFIEASDTKFALVPLDAPVQGALTEQLRLG